MKRKEHKEADLTDLCSQSAFHEPVSWETSFNLIDEKWIPVANCAERKSLKDIFTDFSLKALSGNPVDKIAVFRLLLSIVQASTDIPDDEAWLALTDEIVAENALRYLDQWHDRFDLYGEKPFLQFPQLAGKGEASPMEDLQTGISTGNTVILSEWNVSDTPQNQDIAILLLRSAFIGCGGKKYDSSISLSSGVQKKKTARAGTLLGYAGYLHSYVMGETLLRSVCNNLLTDEDIDTMKVFTAGKGVPFWEDMPQGEDDARAKEYCKSYQGELIPIDKFLLIRGNQIIKTDGILYPGHKEGFVDPAITNLPKGKDFKATWVRTDKHPWRELPALLAFLDVKKEKTPFFVYQGVRKLQKKQAEKLNLWVGGISVSSNAGEQFVSGTDDYVESELAIPLNHIDYEQYSRFLNIVDAMESKAKLLYASVNAYFKETNYVSAGDFASKAVSSYWERMNARVQMILELAFSGKSEAEREEAFRLEMRNCFHTLCGIYENLCPKNTSRQLETWVKYNPRFSGANKNKETK